MARRYGRAPRGERVVAGIPHGHWKTTTFIAALRHDRITAPCVFDGPINGASFLAWVQQALVPTLSAGDIVIMDNLSSHKVAGVHEAIEAVGATPLYLPPDIGLTPAVTALPARHDVLDRSVQELQELDVVGVHGSAFSCLERDLRVRIAGGEGVHPGEAEFAGAVGAIGGGLFALDDGEGGIGPVQIVLQKAR